MQAARPHPWPAFVAPQPLFPLRGPALASRPRPNRAPLPSRHRVSRPTVRRCRPVTSSTSSSSSTGGASSDLPHQPPPSEPPSSASAASSKSKSKSKSNAGALDPVTARLAKRKMSVAGVIFLVITYIWSIILFIPMAIAHPIVLWRDRARRRFHDLIAMAWMRWSLGSVRVTPRVLNPQNVPGAGVAAVYVANHTSYLDIYTFAYLFRRIKYVSKAEIFSIPIVGWAMRMAGNIALLRMNRRGQMEAYRKMVDVVKNGLSLVVFPEGTRSFTGKMRRFQAGAFRAAKQNNAPIVPVTILGTRECMPSHAWVPLCYPKEPFSLVIHPPLDSRNLSVKELQDRAYEAINSALPAPAQTHPPLKHR